MLLSGIEQVHLRHQIQSNLSIDTPTLLQNPRLYHERLSLVPQLPAPKLPLETPLPDEQLGQPYQPESVPEPISETLYETVWGAISFAELFERTRHYTFTILYRESNYPQEYIEDGLQVGYLKLWKRLQIEPQVLINRPIAWVAAFVKNGAWHVLQKERRIERKIVEPSEGSEHPDREADMMPNLRGSTPRHSHETRQVDRRIDIHAAIEATANAILSQPEGKDQDRALWALYCMTMLQVQVTEASQLFRVRHQAMKKAYDDVQAQLKHHLRLYTPLEATKKVHDKGQKKLPIQDITRIRQSNTDVCSERYETLRATLVEQRPDTLERDLWALEGIQQKIPARHHALIHEITDSAMQRAYERIHLLLAAQVDPTITPKRPEKKRQETYAFTPEDQSHIQLLANTLLTEDKGDTKVVAMYAYLCNLSTRSVAKDFGMNEATLRRYRHQVQARFQQIAAQA